MKNSFRKIVNKNKSIIIGFAIILVVILFLNQMKIIDFSHLGAIVQTGQNLNTAMPLLAFAYNQNNGTILQGANITITEYYLLYTNSNQEGTAITHCVTNESLDGITLIGYSSSYTYYGFGNYSIKQIINPNDTSIQTFNGGEDLRWTVPNNVNLCSMIPPNVAIPNGILNYQITATYKNYTSNVYTMGAGNLWNAPYSQILQIIAIPFNIQIPKPVIIVAQPSKAPQFNIFNFIQNLIPQITSYIKNLLNTKITLAISGISNSSINNNNVSIIGTKITKTFSIPLSFSNVSTNSTPVAVNTQCTTAVYDNATNNIVDSENDTTMTTAIYNSNITYTPETAGQYVFLAVCTTIKTQYNSNNNTWSSWSSPLIGGQIQMYGFNVENPSQPPIAPKENISSIITQIINNIINYIKNLFK